MSAPTSELPFDVVNEIDDVPQNFVDGFQGILLSASNAKITFFQTVGFDRQTKRERRKLLFTLVVPTPAMVDFCSKFLKQAELRGIQPPQKPDNSKPPVKATPTPK